MYLYACNKSQDYNDVIQERTDSGGGRGGGRSPDSTDVHARLARSLVAAHLQTDDGSTCFVHVVSADVRHVTHAAHCHAYAKPPARDVNDIDSVATLFQIKSSTKVC